VPDRQEIIWIDFDPQVGKEMRRHHPMLVLSPKTFNARTGIVIGLPMTTAATNESNPFAIKFVGPKGLISYVLSHQPKSFDWRARGARPHHWKQVSPVVLESACESLDQIIAIAATSDTRARS
jgi:mRNA interferase MazF